MSNHKKKTCIEALMADGCTMAVNALTVDLAVSWATPSGFVVKIWSTGRPDPVMLHMPSAKVAYQLVEDIAKAQNGDYYGE